METAGRMDNDNAAALAALSSQGPVGFAAPTPFTARISLCPHCRLGFGSASLQIHVRRCRALLPDVEAEAAAEGAAAAAAAAAALAAKKVKKRQVPTLVNLCLRFITRNFRAVCMDKVISAPENEALLIESLPTDLVHRIITNLVSENKTISEKEDKQRTKVRFLQRELEDMRTQKGQLEAFRHQAGIFRSRLTTQEQLIETMHRDLETARRELASVQHQNVQLQTQMAGTQKARQRSETRMQALTAENDRLKMDIRGARKQEMEAFKRLAISAKSAKPSTTASHHNPPSLQRRPSKRPASSDVHVVTPRPRTEGSKIPFPARLPAAYAAKCVHVTQLRE